MYYAKAAESAVQCRLAIRDLYFWIRYRNHKLTEEDLYDFAHDMTEKQESLRFLKNGR